LKGRALLALVLPFVGGCGAPLTEHGRMLVDVYDSQTIERYCFLPWWLLVVLGAVVAGSVWLGRTRGHERAHRFAAWCVERERALAGALALAAAAFAGWLALGPLEGLPHIQDERAYLFQARLFADGKLAAPVPPAPLAAAAALDFTVQDANGRWYGRFPPGWPAALAVAVRMGQPALLNPLLTALALLGLHLFMRRRVGAGWALVSTFLAATSPLVTFNGGSHMPHLLGLVLLLWAFTGSGLAAGLLFLTRPHEGALAAVYLVATRGLKAWVLPLLAGIALSLAYNHAQTGSALTPPTIRFYAGDRPGFHADAGVYKAEGHNAARGLHNLWVNARISSDVLFGWAFVSLIPALIGLLTDRSERLLLAFAGLYLTVLFFFHNPGIGHGSRYHVFVLPAILWLTVRGLAYLAERNATAVLVTVLYLTAQSFALHYPHRVADVRGFWGVTRVPVEGRPIVLVPHALVNGEVLFDSFEAISMPWPDSAGPVALRMGPGVAEAARRFYPGRPLMAWKAKSD
jgi:hypothetical protein